MSTCLKDYSIKKFSTIYLSRKTAWNSPIWDSFLGLKYSLPGILFLHDNTYDWGNTVDH